MHMQLLFIGTTELFLIGGIALLLFGGKKLPEMMRGLGQGVREFKKGVNDVKEQTNIQEKDDAGSEISEDDQATNKQALTSGENKKPDEHKQ